MPYSHREDFPLPPGADPKFHQPFTMAEWNQSTFASSDRMDWFRDARYGMFIHFGLSTYKNKDLSWGICHTRKLPDVGHGPYPDAEWKSWAGEFKLERFDAREWVQITPRSDAMSSARWWTPVMQRVCPWACITRSATGSIPTTCPSTPTRSR